MENELKNLILNANIDEKINLEKYCNNFISVKFTYNNFGYTWSAKTKNQIMNIYPMASTWIVKFFKTESGAKNNFLKRLN